MLGMEAFCRKATICIRIPDTAVETTQSYAFPWLAIFSFCKEKKVETPPAYGAGVGL